MADLFPGCRLTVSDIRESILKNLSTRFKEAGIETAHLFKADLTDQNDLPRQSFHFIVADLPCTGSGTWSGRLRPSVILTRKPFPITASDRKNLLNITSRLKTSGILVYIPVLFLQVKMKGFSAILAGTGIVKEEQRQMIPGTGRKPIQCLYPDSQRLD